MKLLLSIRTEKRRLIAGYRLLNDVIYRHTLELHALSHTSDLHVVIRKSISCI